MHPWVPKDKARTGWGQGVELKGTAGVIGRFCFYVKQRSKPIEQIGTYIEETESPVGEGSYIWEEGERCKEH